MNLVSGLRTILWMPHRYRMEAKVQRKQTK